MQSASCTLLSMGELLFPFSEYWWFYAGFILFVLAMLALDLGVFNRKPHAISFREAAVWTAVWIGLALVFNLLLYFYAGWSFAQDARLLGVPGFDPEVAARQSALEFLTGLVVEKSLSIDNIFIFAVVFGYFGIPTALQHRVLFYGILGALFFRAIFISLGSVLMQYHWLVVLFGVGLVLTGLKLAFAAETQINPDKNVLIRLCRRLVPVTAEVQGSAFFVRIGDRKSTRLNSSH